MRTKSSNISKSLSSFENELKQFSYKELTTEDAGALRKLFLDFKTQFERKYWNSDSKLYSSKITDTPKNIEEKNSSLFNKNESMLIGKVSHEIRTPLNAIHGFANLLEESGLTQDQMINVNAIQSASNNLLGITNELLEYSELSNGQEKFKAVSFNIRNVIKEITYLCNALIVSKNVVLETYVDFSLPKILIGDPSKLSQVLMNLLGNSIKFVQEGRVELKISATATKNNQFELLFTVSDTGIGIAQENLRKIFEPFQQANSDIHSKYGGSGLGLSIVKQIIETLNGEIEMASKVGVGTVVRFMIPYKKGTQKVVKTPVDIIRKKVSTSLKNKKILVFEDDPLNKKLVDKYITNWGGKVFITESAKYGINILKTNKIDLILMDLRMPKMNGIQVSNLIRKSNDSQVKNIPIITITGDFSAKDKDSYEASGINDFILKPFNSDELLQKILRQLSNNKPPKQNIIIPKSFAANYGTKKHVDLLVLLEECDGDLKLVNELILLFKQNIIEFIEEVRTGIKEQNFESIEFATHKVKHGLKIFKTSSLINLVNKIHLVSADAKLLPEIIILFTEFLEECPKVDEAMNIAFDRLK